MRLFVLALVACHPPRTPAAPTGACLLTEHRLEDIDSMMQVAIKTHQPILGSCRIKAGVRPGTYELRDGMRAIAIWSNCGLDIRSPGIELDGVAVGMSTAALPVRLACETRHDRTECRGFIDDEIDPEVRYILDGPPPATVIEIDANLRCVQ